MAHVALLSERRAVAALADIGDPPGALDEMAAEMLPLWCQLIARVQEAFASAKRQDSLLDFDDLERMTRQLLHTDERVRARYRQAEFRHLLVDEFQDTNGVQYDVLKLLASDSVFVVGDSDQAIYGWRGASATNLPRFTTDFPQSDGSPAPTLELRTSWRNPPEVLHLANEVSQDARRRSVAVRSLQPRPDAAAGTVRAALLSDIVAEREWLADEMARLHRAAVDVYGGCEAPGAMASPYRVELTLTFPATMPDFAERGAGPETLLVEMAPIALMPHAVYVFLEAMRNWRGGQFHRRAPHVLQAQLTPKLRSTRDRGRQFLIAPFPNCPLP